MPRYTLHQFSLTVMQYTGAFFFVVKRVCKLRALCKTSSETGIFVQLSVRKTTIHVKQCFCVFTRHSAVYEFTYPIVK